MSATRERLNEPLGRAFVSDGEYVVVTPDRTIYGPFYSGVVAAMWLQDAHEAEPDLRGKVVLLTQPFKTRPLAAGGSV